MKLSDYLNEMAVAPGAMKQDKSIIIKTPLLKKLEKMLDDKIKITKKGRYDENQVISVTMPMKRELTDDEFYERRKVCDLEISNVYKVAFRNKV